MIPATQASVDPLKASTSAQAFPPDHRGDSAWAAMPFTLLPEPASHPCLICSQSLLAASAVPTWISSKEQQLQVPCNIPGPDPGKQQTSWDRRGQHAGSRDLSLAFPIGGGPWLVLHCTLVVKAPSTVSAVVVDPQLQQAPSLLWPGASSCQPSPRVARGSWSLRGREDGGWGSVTVEQQMPVCGFLRLWEKCWWYQ